MVINARIEDLFNHGEFQKVLQIIDSIKNNNHEKIQEIYSSELLYFECRTYERLGEWQKAWDTFYEFSKIKSEIAEKDNRIKLILLVTENYLLWRLGYLVEGIKSVNLHQDFISNIEESYDQNNQDGFNYNYWLGLYFIIISNFYLNHGDLDESLSLNEKSQ